MSEKRFDGYQKASQRWRQLTRRFLADVPFERVDRRESKRDRVLDFVFCLGGALLLVLVVAWLDWQSTSRSVQPYTQALDYRLV